MKRAPERAAEERNAVVTSLWSLSERGALNQATDI